MLNRYRLLACAAALPAALTLLAGGATPVLAHTKQEAISPEDGAVIVCASFAFRGHVLAGPRLVLGALLTVHLSHPTTDCRPVRCDSRSLNSGLAERPAKRYILSAMVER